MFHVLQIRAFHNIEIYIIDYSVILSTPHGILKSGGERQDKAKHVIFSLDDSGDEENPLQQKRPREVYSALKLPNKIIPVKPTMRASPKLTIGTKCKAQKDEKHKVLENPGKRAKCQEKEEQTANEIEKFRRLYPNQEDDLKANNIKDKNGAKKTPFKNKIKKVMPRAKHQSSKEKMDLMWFDSDSVFGFGIEE